MGSLLKIFTKKRTLNIGSYTVLLIIILLNRFWMFKDIIYSVFRGVPNFYSWILLWNCRVLETLSFKSYWTSNAMFPYKDNIAFSENMIGLTPLALPVKFITDNPVFFTNLFSFLIVIITAFITFYIFKKWSGSHLASLAATMIFVLYPWSMKEFSLGRFHMLAIFFIPLSIFFNIKYIKTKERKFLVYLTILFFWALLSNIYMGVFLTLFICLFNLFMFLYEREIFKINHLFRIGIAVIIAWIIMIPLFLKYLDSGKKIGIVRTLTDQVNYTGPAESWITVPDENLFYGQLLNLLPKGTRDGIVENYMFPGFAAVFLFVAGFFIRGFPPWIKSVRWTGLLMIFISVGPFLSLGSVKIPLPFSFFWYIFPPMRATRNPHRFAIFAIFSIALVSLFVLKEILKKRQGKIIVTFLIIPFILLEAQSFQKVSQAIPKYSKSFYSKLSSLNGKHILAELPFNIHTDLRAMATSVWHPYKILNGVSGLRPPVQTQMENELSRFPSVRTIKLLQSLGVDLIVINENELKGNRRKYLRAVESFNETKFLFRVGMKSAWSVAPGPGMKEIDPVHDLSFEYKQDEIDSEIVIILRIESPDNTVIFNPYAPSKFRFTRSRLWNLRLIESDKDRTGIVKEWEWNPPALFFDKNRVTRWKFEVDYDPGKKYILEIEFAGMKFDLKGKLKK